MKPIHSIYNYLISSQRTRRLLVLLLHGLLGALALTITLTLRFEWFLHFSNWLAENPVAAYASRLEWFQALRDSGALLHFNFWLNTLLLVILVRMATVFYFRLHKGMWRYAGMNDLLLIIKSVSLGTVALIVAILFVYGREFPRAIFLNDWLLTMAFFGGLRFSRRLYSEFMYPMAKNVRTGHRRTLIAGAGSTGEMAVRTLLNDFRGEYFAVGFVDDDPAKQGSRIHDIPVMGKLSQTSQLAAELEISDVVFAIPNPQKKIMRDIVDACSRLNVRFQIMPTFNDMISGKLVRQEIRTVEVDDLLGRDPINLDQEPVSQYLNYKRVLVTGAGGSIGSELARQIAAHRPARLLLLEFAENSLFEIHQELQDLYPDTEIIPLIGDIKNPETNDRVLAEHRPQIIYHAAAYKHVPLMETYPVECIINNVMGTLRLAEAAMKYEAEGFIMISTDKAVRPTSVMGASKRMAELLVSSRQNCGPTKFTSVRFGNVLGSSGSVVPTFRKQMARGGPLTVTHPDISRYFITIPEAVELVLQAGVTGKGGEVFVLDMGEPVKILDLARNMIELSGLREDEDIKIIFTGLRPGEKMHEELVASGEEVTPTDVPKVMVHNPSSNENINRAKIDEEIKALQAAAYAQNEQKAVELLWKIVKNHDSPPCPESEKEEQ